MEKRGGVTAAAAPAAPALGAPYILCITQSCGFFSRFLWKVQRVEKRISSNIEVEAPTGKVSPHMQIHMAHAPPSPPNGLLGEGGGGGLR
ncbi:hypothetical protein POVWA2_031730 [Plasmodium ovale wallikeri]|uniref:Uncharacterized protein n=1 Tax=Plasmodium ovale wallikeri TaxID=864142 RepID=A0A1A8YYE4_PLAOA|nr:hypothetical protein POVWA1_032010 [Plasmodium ovale wallikeri]SBT36741.1 hypothetical protein POVWA2_031730 [Plasmodium ovale wallikeri]